MSKQETLRNIEGVKAPPIYLCGVCGSMLSFEILAPIEGQRALKHRPYDGAAAYCCDFQYLLIGRIRNGYSEYDCLTYELGPKGPPGPVLDPETSRALLSMLNDLGLPAVSPLYNPPPPAIEGEALVFPMEKSA
jgi:hypothetical protein